MRSVFALNFPNNEPLIQAAVTNTLFVIRNATAAMFVSL